MSNLKRDLVKYVRDKAKSGYAKDTECRICGSTEELDFHHYNGLSELLEKWLGARVVGSAEEMMELRIDFIKEHQVELYDEAVTICHQHHLRLHSLYGKRPPLNTAPKQKRWVEKQRLKHGLV